MQCFAMLFQAHVAGYLERYTAGVATATKMHANNIWLVNVFLHVYD